MRSVWFSLVTVAVLALPAAAQQVNSGTSNVTAGDSFHEFIGTSWGLRGRGWFFNFGGGLPGGAAPPFGGFDGSGGLRGGFGFGGGGLSGNFNFMASQGSSRTIGSTSGSITQLNGTQGHLFHGTLRPFVTQIVPVVGGGVPISPLELKLQSLGGPQGLRPPLRLPDDEPAAEPSKPALSAERPAGRYRSGSSAERGDASLADIRRQQAEEDSASQAELEDLLAEAERFETAGEPRAAANVYSRAAAKADGPQREGLIQKMRALRSR